MSVILYALTVRLVIALCTRTFFQPDEYFQALEPAHNIVFGYGNLTWEWLSPLPIRSILYPALNVPIYWALKVTGMHEIRPWGDFLLIIGPRILHGTLAAGTDIWICSLTRRTIGERYVSTSLFLSLTSFFHALSLSRSFSNSLETSLTTIAFSYYPWDASARLSPQLIYNRSKIRKSLAFAALACAIRPTNAVIWIYLFSNLVWALRGYRRTLLFLLCDTIVIGTLVLTSVVGLDYVYYANFTFAPANFLVTNLSGIALFYGGNPWHYYLSQALPMLCITSLPFTVHSLWTQGSGSNTATKTMRKTVAWTIGVYSFTGHKEWRFIHSLLPILHVLASQSLVDLSAITVTTKTHVAKPRASITTHFPPVRKEFLAILLMPIPITGYVVLLYCSGPISVTSYIRSIPTHELQGGSVGILMPCHSLPGQAYIHRKELENGGMWALGCEPPLGKQNLSTYRDQTDVFFSSPYQYLMERFPPAVDPAFPVSPFPASLPGVPTLDAYPWVHEWPRHLIFFGALLREQSVKDLLIGKGYTEVWHRGRFWEGDSDERKGGVCVWKWMG
ncbi:glycosyltransferase family 22 protein [Guyanagaster necrorhizus]|uniref:Mannosyltransferase n=1 Tax=Guyanagaster necrorhizus TaxID=856835 RepID=A0A9P7VWX2_9AGAR|nr:glycosyltransferase family 22 protein [Guyanagaster necrorhizus MCA 3950]KAG7448062.1 glycosyltransferase family 22 protein [Guyanagaster necrorhizus MCA 3950]